jgi:hypothetical protein
MKSEGRRQKAEKQKAAGSRQHAEKQKAAGSSASLAR